MKNALVAELADAPDLGSGVLRREGSSPFRRTKKNPKYFRVFRIFLLFLISEYQRYMLYNFTITRLPL